MKDFSFKALIVFVIVLVSGLILLPILRPDTDNVGGNGGNYELLVDNELMDFVEDETFYRVSFNIADYKIILVYIYFIDYWAGIVQNMIYSDFVGNSFQYAQLIKLPGNFDLHGIYTFNSIIIPSEYIGDINITVWGVSK